MATVTVITFSSPEAAGEALAGIKALQEREQIALHDAALVTWPPGRRSPSSRQLGDLATTGALGGVFWGALFGLVFFTPLFGMAVGVAVSALGGAFKDYGIDDQFIRRVRGAVIEGTSALFLMTSDNIIDRLGDTLKNRKFEIMATNLSKDQERRLREAFVG